MQNDAPEGHGWWPYVVPYVAFLLLSEVGARLPESAALFMLACKPAVVLGLVVWFRRGGAYPEWWRNPPVRMTAGGFVLDVLVGLALTVVWVVPYVLVPALRPEPGGAFDPAMAGETWVPVVLGLRLFGYAIVTPVFEELFIRSFVMRVAETWESDRDFRDAPIARYSARSLIVTTVVFSIGHVPWEWWVCVPWIVASSVWFYYRRNLTALMVVHATTNASLLSLAVFGGDWLQDADGTPFSFWFFV